MSIHFTISLGLIVACSIHAFIFLNFDINQDIKILKKENTLNIILSKIPEKKTVLEMPVAAPSSIEKVEQVEKPIQKPITQSKKTKIKKNNKKQGVKNKKRKKEIIENVELPKNNVKVDEQLEMPSENANVVSEKPLFQETPSKKIKEIKTMGCADYSHCPKPHYPFVAKQRGITGSVKLALKIDETGSVIDAKILASEPEDTFEEAALEAVLQWRNLPEQLYNTTIEQKIEFKLDN